MTTPAPFDQCICWVSRADDETRYTARRGAHNYFCPVYGPSRDPVDALKDMDLKRWGMIAHRIRIRPITNTNLNRIVDGLLQDADGLSQGNEDAPPPH